MSTNYYAEPVEACAVCGHREERLHIGKSSAGWTFGLRVYPERGIEDWPDWVRWLESGEWRIVDEYGKEVTLTDLTRTVTQRAPGLRRRHDLAGWYECDAVRFPEGVTYDLVALEFS